MKKKQMLRVAGIFLPLLLFSILGFGQGILVRGKVTDNTGAPIPGATVVVQGTTLGTITDPDGNFILDRVNPDGTLVFSFVGLVSQEVPVSGRTVINVTMLSDVSELEEVVVVGYGTQRREAVTGSVASMSGDDIRQIPSSNFTNSIQGRLPGVELSQTSSRPDATMQIRIRGTRSLTASNDPLVVLDGIPFVGSINEINTNDIKSLDILKDASATAVYGSRGANGVILITTNRGQKGQKAKVTYNGNYGVNKIFAKYPMMNGPELAAIRKIAQRYSNGPDEFDDVNIDWQDLFFRDGFQTSHDVTLAGGTTNGRYSFGV
ncbi:MAG TPA: TonB-dependent receptor plug domain-containing protein, partial [Prolixibacteraceae bacterium]|nr:TonB-dependent receptor plug domain-containing protein [Prolixibacteraceae bacterium]